MQYSMCKTVCMHLFQCPSVWWLEKQFSPWLQPCWLSGPSHGPRSVPGVRTTGRCFHVLSVGKLQIRVRLVSAMVFWAPILALQDSSAVLWCLNHCTIVVRSFAAVILTVHQIISCLLVWVYFFPYRSKSWLEEPVTAPYEYASSLELFAWNGKIKQSLCANTQQPPLTPFILGFHVGAGQSGHPNSCGNARHFFHDMFHHS